MPPKRAASKQESTQQPAMVPLKPSTPTGTPAQSPSKRAVGITAAQRQALVDNLQLEISERARKLRAQYALQAQGLRARLEMRVNRIPQALRKRKMCDLAEEHAEKERAKEEGTNKRVKMRYDQIGQTTKTTKPNSTPSPQPPVDQENQTSSSQTKPHDLPNPKKRATKATQPITTAPTTANTKATRTTSRQNTTTNKLPPPPSRPINPAGVLSPRSHNSQTNPAPGPSQSPEKSKPQPLSHATFAAARSAVSPAKPAAPQLSTQHANAAANPRSRTTSRQAGPTAVNSTTTKTKPTAPARTTAAAKKNAEKERRQSRESDDTSVGTTIVNRTTAPSASGKKAGGVAAAAAATASSAGKKTGGVRAAMRDAVDKGKKAAGTAGKKENVAPAASGRVLRKRA
ncbi:hypothetical protein MBLNU230_g4339t1 [Neophaeotheca triangularis]